MSKFEIAVAAACATVRDARANFYKAAADEELNRLEEFAANSSQDVAIANRLMENICTFFIQFFAQKLL